MKAYVKPVAVGIMVISVAVIATLGVLKFRERHRN